MNARDLTEAAVRHLQAEFSEEASADSRMSDLGLDSMDMEEVAMAVEEQCGVVIQNERMRYGPDPTIREWAQAAYKTMRPDEGAAVRDHE